MYHPSLFKTSMCHHISCIYGRECAHAHSDAEMREKSVAAQQFENKIIPQPRRIATLSSFLQEEQQVESLRNQGHKLLLELQEQHQWPIDEVCLKLTDRQDFMISKSKIIFGQLEALAFENGLCVIEKKPPRGLKIRGIHVQDTMERVLSSLEQIIKSGPVMVETRPFSERVVAVIEKLMQSPTGRQKIVTSPNVRVEINQESITVLAVTEQNQKVTAQLINHIFDKINFWVDREGYDKLIECFCCLERRNFDQGVQCKKGHFICAIDRLEDDCLSMGIASQINNIAHQNNCVLCQICKSAYTLQEIASHLEVGVFQRVESAIVDGKVKSRAEAMSDEFNQRLEAKVQELLEKHGA